MIYLDNAATTRTKPQAVIDAVVSAMNSLGNSGRGANDASLDASRVIFEARQKLASLFHCKADHVVFTCNATEALNIAISGLFSNGDHILSTDLEHNSVLRPLYRLQESGVEVSFLPADRAGNIDYDDFERLLQKNTRAVVCTHASNLTGTLTDVHKIGEFCKKHGLLFVLDASQTAGSFPIDMEKNHIDVLCFTGHKAMLGPQGTGGLCVREGVNIRPFKVGGTGVQSHLKTQPEQMPTKLEAGTLNAHGIAGLSAAVDFLQEVGIDNIRQKEAELTKRFYEGVKEIPGVTVYGDFACERAPIVSLNIRDYPSSAVSDELMQSYGIATRSGAHCAPRLHEALGTDIQGAVRFSFGYFNTNEEIDTAIRAVAEIAK